MFSGGSTLKPEFSAKGIRNQRALEPVLGFNYFNMNDPVVGGYSIEKIAANARFAGLRHGPRNRDDLQKAKLIWRSKSCAGASRTRPETQAAPAV